MKFISIIGYDRSGTTFMGSYYTHFTKNVFYAGEIDKAIQILKSTSDQIVVCSCGKPYPDCPVWGQIKKSISSGELKNLKDIVFRLQAITGAEIILDTSKQLDRLKEYSEIFKDQFYTIHIKRNPKGVILSRMKNRKRRVKEKSHPKPFIARRYNMMMIYDSLEWTYRNFILEQIKVRDRNLELTYDFLPNELPNKLIAFNNDHDIAVDESKITNHILWGDKRRTNFDKNIRLNSSWQTQLNTFQKITVDLLTWPLRSLKNYRFK
ncbi:hypothetical protein SAMN06296241_1886 [Salinimicrobium sediminis]|uniref:Sulfotransferase family protein n=1 Tax=Salinimicrobium sediminis TaxID=1343891 RepID=A0A285X4Y8_9FLAO|nr:hypothetical protein [Salinimicrobium sediminis]SOC80338.1 hypothetical protein SAMN06296241_1886 [Salinimicrobium sediminis]